MVSRGSRLEQEVRRFSSEVWPEIRAVHRKFGEFWEEMDRRHRVVRPGWENSAGAPPQSQIDPHSWPGLSGATWAANAVLQAWRQADAEAEPLLPFRTRAATPTPEEEGSWVTTEEDITVKTEEEFDTPDEGEEDDDMGVLVKEEEPVDLQSAESFLTSGSQIGSLNGTNYKEDGSEQL